MAQQIPQQYNPEYYPTVWEALRAPIPRLPDPVRYVGFMIGGIAVPIWKGLQCGLNLENISNRLIVKHCFPEQSGLFYLLETMCGGAISFITIVVGHTLYHQTVHVFQTLAYQRRQRMG